jgi:hypothetical protein
LIRGNRAKRILHGVLNIWSGEVLVDDYSRVGPGNSPSGSADDSHAHWGGWRIVLFEDRGSPHTAEASQGLAAELSIPLRFLPRATPELNALDHLWREVKRQTQANCEPRSIEQAADAACHYIFDLSPHKRLRKAGVLSGNFWLAR